MSFKKLGPGVLAFGKTLSETEFATACSKVTISPELEQETPIPLLSGDTYASEGTAKGTLSGTILQDFELEGLIAWSWKHAGKTVPFIFRPSNESELGIKGRVRISPIEIGGEVNKTNSSDFSFELIGGLPEMGSFETLKQGIGG